MQQDLTTYALIAGLEKWVLEAGEGGFPDWIFQDKKELAPYIETAEDLLLKGQSIQFDPHKPSSLACIFNYLTVNKRYSEQETLYYPFMPLDLKREHLFPGHKGGTYEELCRGFRNELSNLPGDAAHPEIYGQSLFFLLKKYFWCVPVSSELPYIQLFEFLKVRAAVALSLRAFDQATAKEECQLQLYCVDQSGIQDFLYNIASNKAAKSLKGRSFYLQLLLETVIQLISNDDRIPAGAQNVLYASGGKMYFILPNTAEVNAALLAIEEKLLKKLYDAHGLELYLATAKVVFGWDGRKMIYQDEKGQIQPGEVKNIWPLLTDRTRRASQQAYRSLIADDYDKFFNPNEADGFDDSEGTKKVCAVTGNTLNIDDPTDISTRKKHDMLYHKQNIDDREPIWVKEVVKKQVDIGYKLQQVKYYKTFFEEKTITPAHEKYLVNPLALDIYQGMAEDNNIKDELTKLRSLPSFKFAIIKKINDPINFLPSDLHNTQQADHSAYGFSFYGGNLQAFDAEKLLANQNIRKAVKDYTELAGIRDEGDKHQGFHRLGVLRMDVDNLGRIFSDGMADLQFLPAYSTLSAQLDIFFSGFLNTIREENQEMKDHLNIIYAGGDDIFVVGRWDLAITFAERVRKDFRAFVNKREEISISGGLVLVNPKFPIAKSASYAGEAEDEAKDFGRPSPEAEAAKNAFCLFDMPISWDEEFDRVKDLKMQLVDFWEQGQLSAGFLQKMLEFQIIKNQHLHEIRKKEAPDYSFLWTSAFYISRVQARFKSQPKTAPIQHFLAAVKHEFFIALTNEGRYFDLIAVAARWAELEIRMKATQHN